MYADVFVCVRVRVHACVYVRLTLTSVSCDWQCDAADGAAERYQLQGIFGSSGSG